MLKEELVMVCCSDIAGQIRGKAVPAKMLQGQRRSGVGWTPTNIMITAHGPIAESPWGSFDDLVLRPDLDTHVRVDFEDGEVAEQFVLGDILHLDGRPWECCLRDFLKRALDDLRKETGLVVKAAFEHEFHYDGVDEWPNSAYSLDAFRRQGSFGEVFTAALAAAGIAADTFMPEYGPNQYEITVEPEIGLGAADQAIITRELARATARRFGARASFTPLLRPDAVGNGVHVHFSLQDADSGQPVNHDPDQPHGISKRSGAFLAGVLDKLPSLVALTAPSNISYLRLVPHRWSAAYNNLGVQDREAALRVCPVFQTLDVDVSRQFHFEYRAADASASPYLVLGALVRAGLDGIRAHKPIPQAARVDPSTLSEQALQELGLARLPTSLSEALDRLESDQEARGWLGAPLHEVYLAHKRFEAQMMSELAADQQCARYLEVY